jgi:hypothetical protein
MYHRRKEWDARKRGMQKRVRRMERKRNKEYEVKAFISSSSETAFSDDWSL